MRNFESINHLINELKFSKRSYHYIIEYLRVYQTLDVRPNDEDNERGWLISELETMQALIAKMLNEMQTSDAEYDAFLGDKIAHEEGLAIEAKYGWNPNHINPF